MALHLAILAAGARGHKRRHGNARPVKRLRPIHPNHVAELKYRSGILQLVSRCKSIVDGQLAALESHWPRPTSADGVRVGDSLPYSIEAFIRSAKGKLGGLDEWTKRMVGLAVEANRDSVDDRLAREIKRAIGVDVGHLLHANGPLLQAMKTATKDNVALIKSIPEKYFGRVTETLTAGWTGGVRWESLVDQIQRDGDITENRAKLIARDQTSKMNSSFNQERQQQVGIEKFEWSTSEDERVRESHAELDGKIFSWDDPPIVDDEVATPGSPILCRCVAIPFIDMGDAALGFGTNEQQEEIAA
jgi:SPP1 gp7 family putative phage head morphogenesis protein